jgi:phosphoglycerate dehydrogenase-like enzyme
LKLVIKATENDGRFDLLPTFLNPTWQIEVADTADPVAFADALRDADAFISMRWRAPLPAAPHLKLLQLPGAGLDEIDLGLVPPGAAVCNCFEHEIGMAKFVLCAMLERVIDLRALDASLRRGEWTGSYLCGPLHGELYGRTVGLVGYGRIGREVARRAQAFGMQLRAVSRTSRSSDELIGSIEPLSALPRLLQASDFVVVTLPLAEGTAGLLDAAALAHMKPTAWLINVSRGGIIDEQALFEALRLRRIGGAVIDVWYRYPPPDRPAGRPASLPFHELSNVVMTPHASAWTDGLLPRRNRAMAENLNRLARGMPLLNVVRAPRSQAPSACLA